MMYETLNCSNVFGWFELGAAVVVRSCLFFEVQIMRFGICFFFLGGYRPLDTNTDAVCTSSIFFPCDRIST